MLHDVVKIFQCPVISRRRPRLRGRLVEDLRSVGLSEFDQMVDSGLRSPTFVIFRTVHVVQTLLASEFVDEIL